jgi:hypothetical protein
MMKIVAFIFLLFFAYSASAQIEFVQTEHPVYPFLINQEAKGLLPHFSTSDLPWQRKDIVKALRLIAEHQERLSEYEKKALKLFETEFEIRKRENTVVFYSDTDTNQILFKNLFSQKDKFIYHYAGSSNKARLTLLADLDNTYIDSDTAIGNALMGNLGIRFYGSLSGHVGYYLQITNGTVFAGDKWAALYDNKLQQNIKFAELNSDFDFTESHVSYTYDWFTGVIGRQTRFTGSGIVQKTFMNNVSPAIDGLTLSANFESFKYSFSSFSLLAIPDSTEMDVGFKTFIPTKLSSMHRFALRPEWGEIAFWEAVVYSDRGFDLSYLNPLSFFKSLEHANRDRDNSLMGFDYKIRPLTGLQLVGSFLLDDIIFEELGTGYWSNKFAYNFGLSYTSFFGLLGVEYARVEPYTFSHFNPQNSYTNDRLLIGSYIMPNSDMVSLVYQFYWLGNRYPWYIRVGYERHGENIYDGNGKLIYNVGSDPLQTRRPEDKYYVTFLDGQRIDSAILELNFAYEIVRNFKIAFLAFFKIQENGHSYNNFRLKFSFRDF